LQQVSVGAQLQVPLFDGRAWSDLGAARAAHRSAEASAAGARLAAEAALVKACWLGSAAEEQLLAARSAAEDAITYRDRAQRRLDAGVGVELDVLQAEVEQARRESAAVQAEADLARARRVVGALLGTGGGVRCVVPEVAPTAVADAAGDAPAVVAAEHLADAADRAVASAWWRHAPTLAANASVAWQSTDFPTGLPYAWRVGLSLTWVMYDGGARYALLDAAQARQAGADAAWVAARLDADRAVADARDAVRVATERAVLADAAMRTADRAAVAADRAWAAGLLTGIDVLDAQQRLMDARFARAGARAQIGAATADLAVALGQPAGGL
jgi:outer membrane protein TolC